MLLLVLLACNDKNVTCTLESRSSVVVTILSESGLDEPTLTYSVGDGEVQEAEAYQEDRWIAGWEESGTIQLTAEANICPDLPECICIAQEVVEVLVPLTNDGCHVVTQELTISLDQDDIIEEACLD